MTHNSLTDDVGEAAAVLGRTEDRRPGAITDDVVRVVAEAGCPLEAELVVRGEDPSWTTSGPQRSGR